MSRTKGSKNKPKDVKVKRKRRTKAEIEAAAEETLTPVKRKRRTKIEIEENETVLNTMNVFMFDLDELKTIKVGKAGLGVQTKKVEFAVLADSRSKSLELKFNLIGLSNTKKDIKSFSESQKFNIVLTPEIFKSLLEYLKKTPRNKIERSLKKLQTSVLKEKK